MREQSDRAQKLRMLPPVPNKYMVIWMIEGPHQVSKSKVNLIIIFFVTLSKWAKKCLNHPGKRSNPPILESAHLDVDKKVPQTIRASIVTLPNPPPQMAMPVWTDHLFQKEASLTCFRGKGNKQTYQSLLRFWLRWSTPITMHSINIIGDKKEVLNPKNAKK